MNPGNSSFMIMVAGVAIFLYGMTMASQSMEKLLAQRISQLLSKLADSQFLAIVVGISITTILQSSGAVTSMLVGLGSARVINLRQVMGVIIGTAIGSTLTVQLISLDIAHYALPIFTLGFIIYFTNRQAAIKNFGMIIMGFGLLFLGLFMISTTAHEFAANPSLQDFFVSLRENPFLSLLISTVFCALVQSSAITIGVAMSLAAAKSIDLHDAMIWVYGANIGTTFTAILAAVGSNYIGKQVAWAHFFYKTVSVILFYPFTEYLLWLVETFNVTSSRVIANSHLIFNLASAILFYPFIEKGSRLIEKLFPRDANSEFGAEFLKLNNYQSSALATSYAQREIMRTADIFLGMLRDSIRLFERPNPVLIESIKERDNKVDYLYREIKMFLLDHANKSSSAVHQNIMSLIMFITDLERAADAIDINICTLAIKKNALKLEFEHHDWDEIVRMHASTSELASLAVNAFQNKDLAPQAIQLKRALAKTEFTLREHHIGRLHQGLRDSINTSSIHLDLLSEYRRIASLLCNHAYGPNSEFSPAAEK
ncbi:MAG: Na/Pi cotransporter family protein [Bdellovibrionota bacterium]